MAPTPESELTRIIQTFIYAARKDLENELAANGIPDNSFPAAMFHNLDTINTKGSLLTKIYTFKGGDIPRLAKYVMDELLESAHTLLSQHTVVTRENVAEEIECAIPDSTVSRVFDYMNSEFGTVLREIGDSKNWISSKFTDKLSPVASNPVDRAIYETAFVYFLKALANNLCILHHYRPHSLDTADWRTIMALDGTFSHAELSAQIGKLPVRESKPRKPKGEAKPAEEKPAEEPKAEVTVVVEPVDPVSAMIAAI